MKKNIILMGPPGAGKGTLAKQLKDELHLVHISTGDMFRDAIQAQTELGKLAQKYINDGHLVPDEVTIGLVKERLSQPDCEAGFLLDGFPRTTAQAEALEKISREISREIDVAINLDCDHQELVRRISGRRVCKNCGAPYHIESMKPKQDGVCDLCGGPLYQRKDDNEEALKVRLEHYDSETKPLLEFYSKRGLLESFNSLLGKEQLFDEVSSFLKK
ncbi:MAG: adenylate kinase [Bacilli bacterium]|nr:adenylate kinase [Bacilli bacterium]